MGVILTTYKSWDDPPSRGGGNGGNSLNRLREAEGVDFLHLPESDDKIGRRSLPGDSAGALFGMVK